MSSPNQRFEQGPPAEEIHSLFTSIAHGYDRANDWMTGGMARSWRKKLVQFSGAKPDDAVLDCATGTGDLAIDFARVIGPKGRVVGTDFCEGMLEYAPKKASKAGVVAEFSVADAMDLPFANNEFDFVSIAYGIRNVGNPKQAISEFHRVCKPGGSVLILETGDQQNPIVQSTFDFYFKYVVPHIGGWLTGKKAAYQYLQKSSSQFPSGEEFLQLMRESAEFSSLEAQTLMFGASFLYKGTVKKNP